MKLHQLITSNNWFSIELIFKNIYTENNSIEAHKAVFENLQTLKPLESSISIVIKNVVGDFDGSTFVDVSGFENSFVSKNEMDSPYKAIEYTAWEQWLGMEIETETLQNFSELEIISHCLYEMTFAGFNQEEIKEQLNSIVQKTNDIKNMTEEERNKNSRLLDDFLKELGNED